jgi:hypothetical protein
MVRIDRLSGIAGMAAVLLLAGCRSQERNGPSGPPSSAQVSGQVTASRVSGGVRIENGTSTPISYVVYNPNWLGLLAPCSHPDSRCPSLSSGSAVTVADGDIHGFASGVRRVAVRYWAAGDAGGKEVIVDF